ncbi:MAG: squalene synthase HpnC [Planctomycetes bacterium]|nr:squalene synthase HpnC [Planctomycetota bacterium]
MTASTIKQLELNGPLRCESMTVDQARQWCRKLSRKHYENFTVLSGLVPRNLRNDFGAVYAFCRWADDLGDEVDSPEKSLELLKWWRQELDDCFEGNPRHPVFVALTPTIDRHNLPKELFENLITAFEQDQSVTRYENWDQLINYCKLSADPVGRLVLMISGEPRTEELFSLSDKICTALQLANHWQDVKRDILGRDRIYIPRNMIKIDDFERRLTQSAQQGYAVDRTFLGESRLLIKACVEKTWPLFEQGQKLLAKLSSDTRPVVGLLASGGHRVLRLIELWNYETVLHRPKIGKTTKLALIMKAWLSSKFASNNGRSND